MDTDSLADFIMLAECKSFSRAAELRNITQPAFSRRIQSLENAVGAALIDRKSKAFKLTAPGKRFLTHARNLVALADSAKREAQSFMTHLAEPLHLVMPSFISKTFFPNWYKTMQRAAPDVRMHVMLQKGKGAIDDLHKGLADFALLLHTDKMEPYYDFDGLKTRVIGKDKLLAVRGAHAKNNDLLMYEHGSYMTHCAEAVLGKRAASDKIVFESSSTGLMKEMALAGFGTVVLQHSLVEDELTQSTLKQVAEIPGLNCDILLVRADKPLSKKAESLWAANAPAASTAKRA